MGAKRLLPALLFTALVTLGGAIIALFATLPDPAAFRDAWPESTAYMHLRAAHAEAEGRQFRLRYSPVPLARIPASVQRAVRVSEDAAFFQHRGFDWYEVRQAVGKALEEGEAPRGASTITQQLARNLYLSPSRHLFRKLREALITERLEARLSKQRIFELYLNVIEFGPGVFGVEAAARHYFGIPVAEVGPREAAALAATIPAPRTQNPLTDTRGFRWRAELAYARAFGESDTLAEGGMDALSRPNGSDAGLDMDAVNGTEERVPDAGEMPDASEMPAGMDRDPVEIRPE